jgi:prepilin-type N-terminal cleavage/methylation domain-containing protein
MRKFRNSGFTLIEIIGVLMIISILATAIVPSLSSQITRALADREDASLESIGNALRQLAVSEQVIADTAGWESDISPYLELPISEIRNNRAGLGRRLIFHPGLFTGAEGGYWQQAAYFSGAVLPNGKPSKSQGKDKGASASEESATGVLPWTSTVLNGQFLLVSDFKLGVPQTAFSVADFEAVWNQAGSIPNGFKQGESLRIYRGGLSSCFQKVLLSVQNSAATDYSACSPASHGAGITNACPSWAVDGGIQKYLPDGNYSLWIMTGTQIDLGMNNSLSASFIISGSRGFVFHGSDGWSF